MQKACFSISDDTVQHTLIRGQYVSTIRAFINKLTNTTWSQTQSRGKDPRTSLSGGLTYAQGPHVTYGKNFLGACRCMTVVVL